MGIIVRIETIRRIGKMLQYYVPFQSGAACKFPEAVLMYSSFYFHNVTV
jgi:hypothetical protein